MIRYFGGRIRFWIFGFLTLSSFIWFLTLNFQNDLQVKVHSNYSENLLGQTSLGSQKRSLISKRSSSPSQPRPILSKEEIAKLLDIYSFDPASPLPWQQNLVEQAGEEALLAGNRSEGIKSLVLGLASVWRKENYLQKTLQSLIDQSDESERKDAVIVIYLADPTSDKLDLELTMIKANFQEFLDSGFFLVIRAGPEIYPPSELAVAKKTYNDPDDRIRWRSKQVIDFTFLFTYAQPLAHFYVVLEDDLIASPQYLSGIGDFVKTRNKKYWAALQFTEFLGIGLLFRTKDLPALVQMLFMFYQNHPVDVLMKEFIHLQVQPDGLIMKRVPSLFQHIGVQSTLAKKVQKLTDKSFGIADRQYKNLNPSATLVTSMNVFKDFFAALPYQRTPGYFCGTAGLNDTLTIIFDTPQSISRIVITSGLTKAFSVDKKGQSTPLEDAILEYSVYNQKGFQPLQDFKGTIDFSRELSNVGQVRVRIKKQVKNPVTIREIQIFQ